MDNMRGILLMVGAMAAVAVEEHGGQIEAASEVGQGVLSLETVPSGQWTATKLRAVVSLALFLLIGIE